MLGTRSKGRSVGQLASQNAEGTQRLLLAVTNLLLSLKAQNKHLPNHVSASPKHSSVSHVHLADRLQELMLVTESRTRSILISPPIAVHAPFSAQDVPLHGGSC